MRDFWQRIERQQPSGYWEDLFVTLRQNALLFLDQHLATESVLWHGSALPKSSLEAAQVEAHRCHVWLNVVDRLDSAGRDKWLAELGRDTNCQEIWLLVRSEPDRAAPSLVRKLIEEALGPTLHPTEFLRRVHLTTTFRLDLKKSFERRGLRLDLLHFVRDDPANL